MIRLDYILVLATSLALGGCSLGGLLDKGASQPNVNVPVGNDLAMPPSLQLPQPGTGVSDTFANSSDAVGGDNLALNEPTAPAANRSLGKYPSPPGTPAGSDVFEQNGISKLKPDGTVKSTSELNAELKQVFLRKKREQNPGYGTIRNIGSIFTDG